MGCCGARSNGRNVIRARVADRERAAENARAHGAECRAGEFAGERNAGGAGAV